MTIKLFHPDASSCSVGGTAYEKGHDGAFEVQDDHAAPLLDHGFTTIQPEGFKPAKKAKKGEE